MAKSRILFVIHERFTNEVVRSATHIDLGHSFYDNDEWGNRPNSTQRLSLVNLQAIRQIEMQLGIVIRTDRLWSDKLAELYRESDVIVINSISSPVSVRFSQDLLAWKRTLGEERPYIVFGTEATWLDRFSKGEISARDIEDFYFGDLLLRHTARTEAELYLSQSAHRAAIQEFEIGIDFSSLPIPKPIQDRKTIAFVRAPEGRRTKNNEGIDELIQLIKERPELREWKIREISPPYSVVDYWETLTESAFLLFTSLGETFSYALHDAKALGVITFFPEAMYRTDVAGKFAVDAYPQIGIRYRTSSQAVGQLVDIARDSSRLERESSDSFEATRSLFSLDKIAANWKSLLSGECLNTEGLFIYGPGYPDWDHVIKKAEALGCSVVMPYENRKILDDSDKLAYYDRCSGISRVMDYIVRGEEGALHQVLQLEEDGSFANHSSSVFSTDAEHGSSYLQLMCRTYKISRIFVDEELRNTDVLSRCSSLTYYSGLYKGVAAIPTELV